MFSAKFCSRKLAERYKDHPALLIWHASNEYNGGDCHCELCYAAFRDWLKVRYNSDIDKLNHAYWSSFWSHTFPDWDYIVPTDNGIHGLMLDWERFKTAQTIDFFKIETAPLRDVTPAVPITTNFMNGCDTLDYWAFARAVDVISWDSYPNWHESTDEVDEAVRTARQHDQCRAMKGGKPFMLMVHHKAPHRNWDPAERHMSKYEDIEIPEPENLFDDYENRAEAGRGR